MCAEAQDPRRYVPLTATYNARDLGGYRTLAGRTVRWGRVYRSSALNELIPEDVATLADLGVRVICDFRSGPERLAAPNTWAHASGMELWGYPPGEEVGDSRRLLENSLKSPEETRALMTQTYRRIPFDQAPSYAYAFGLLADGRGPLLFHCSAGKDRSGVAAALLLDVLGVPRRAVFEDYLLSNRMRDRIEAVFLADPRHVAAAQDPRRCWEPLLAADPAYLEAMFESVESTRGSVAGYFAYDLAIDAARLESLRQYLLET